MNQSLEEYLQRYKEESSKLSNEILNAKSARNKGQAKSSAAKAEE